MKLLDVINEQRLDEIDMSPSNLEKIAAGIDALAGMEFEMIVPNTDAGEVEPEWEPDYDQDQRARSFGDVRDFFYDGDYNSRRDADNLIEELSNEYEEWISDQTAEAWARDGADFMYDYISLNDLFDRDEAMTEARDQVMDANPDLPQESEDLSKLISARLDEMEREFAQSEFENQGRIYNDAFEAFAEDQREEYDEGSFLDDKYPYMTDIQNNFDISWPHYYDLNDGQEGEMDVDQVADEFSSFMGKPVNASRNYHGARREAGHYVVEPDGSLEGDNPGDGGLEFVSPPMPISEMLADLDKVKKWADRTGCYTNDSTGLHINVSVSGFSLDKLDYTKLALLLGDKYVLEQFGRLGNTYAKSAFDIVKERIKQRPEETAIVLDKMKQGLASLAGKVIHSGATSKYTSINTKSGYIEFRSPGGDWLNENFDLIKNTLLRFVVALDAALDENKYKDEYAKKLYKLLSPSNDTSDTLQYFAKFSAGELPQSALKSFVKQAQLQRNITKGKAPAGKKYWWNVSRPGYFASVEVVAASREEAIEKGKVEYPDWRNSTNMTAEPLRPYVEPETTGAAGPTLNGRPSNPDGNWIIVDRRAPTTPVYRFMASGDSDALLVLRQWIEANRESGVEWNFAPDANQRMGQPGTQSAAQSSAGNWGIFMTNANRFARAPGQIDNSVLRRFPSREAAEQFIAQAREQNPRMRSDVEVREIPDNYELPSSPAGRPVAAAQPATAPRTLTTPGQPQQQFTGEWKIVDANDRELHRFGGVGNVQADANRVAMNWLRQNPQHMQSGVQVLPVME